MASSEDKTCNHIPQMKIDVISKEEEDCNPDYAHQNCRTPSCDFDIKSTCDVELKSIYSEVIENCRKRILKNPKTGPKWLEPDRKVRYVEVLRTYHTEYMPEEYLEIIALLTREAKMARV